jgi:DNA replication and repair protein RecF
MHLARLRLRDFRNYARMDAVFSPGFHLLLGPNAQGKTNLLEAIYLLATLRSFRGVGSAYLVRQGQRGYLVNATVVSQVEHDIRIYWSAAERRLSLDQRPVRRLTDFWGTLRAVVFCTEDLQLVKGAARIRRRFLDLLLSQTHPGYLPLLQRYMQALRARNVLLKQRPHDPAALEGFSRELIPAGTELIRLRRELIPRFAPRVRQAFGRIAGAAEVMSLDYLPSVKADFAVELAQSAKRELAFRSTLVGPHRDDFRLAIQDRSAAQYGSEGQKRTLAIALKIAQAEFLGHVHGSAPVLLIDDVMGELDAQRRAAFLPLLDQVQQQRGQVFMTCTEENWPRELGRDIQRWDIQAGRVCNQMIAPRGIGSDLERSQS